MKLRFIVVSSVNWVHYAHFLCRYSNLNRMCNFLRALNIWLSVSSSPVSIFPARSPLFSDPVNRPAATACTCTRVSLQHTGQCFYLSGRARSLFGVYTHARAPHGIVLTDLYFGLCLSQNSNRRVIMHSTVTPPCFPQATGSAFLLPLSGWQIRSNCKHGS